MDIIVIEKTEFNITIAVGLSNDETKFNYRIKKINEAKQSNLVLFESVKEKIEDVTKETIIDIMDLYYYGNFKDFTSYGKILKPYRESRDRKTLYYRDFTKTLEQQKDIDWLINKCPDARMSYQLLAKTISKKYGIIAKFRLK